MMTHKWQRLVSLAAMAAVVLGLLGGNSVWAVTYKTVDLSPNGFNHSNAMGSSGTQQIGYGYGPGDSHALLWSGTVDTVVDLNPTGVEFSQANGTDGTKQVGFGRVTGIGTHALLWSGAADSFVDLNPTDLGFGNSCAYGISGTQQVGYGIRPNTGNLKYALLWNGTPTSAVELHPSGFLYSIAYGTNGTQQIGYGSLFGVPGGECALLWSGTADSVVNLNSAGLVGSMAFGISGTQQVGCGNGGSNFFCHAFLWRGTADSAIDLNPSGFVESRAWGTNGIQQVGEGIISTGNDSHALLWSGSAASAIDLHQLLPSGFNKSVAQSIDEQGNIVGYAIDASGNSHAMLWAPIPDPPTWKGANGGSFQSTANWIGGNVPDDVDATANFPEVGTDPCSIKLESSVILGFVNFSSSSSYRIEGDSSIVLQTRGGNAILNIQAGSHEIAAPVILRSDAAMVGDGSLCLSSGISGNHTFIVESTLSASSIQVDTLIIGNSQTMPVPEPSCLVLLGMGALGVLAWGWKLRRKAEGIVGR